jgi:hypothetical protein
MGRQIAIAMLKENDAPFLTFWRGSDMAARSLGAYQAQGGHCKTNPNEETCPREQPTESLAFGGAQMMLANGFSLEIWLSASNPSANQLTQKLTFNIAHHACPSGIGFRGSPRYFAVRHLLTKRRLTYKEPYD